MSGGWTAFIAAIASVLSALGGIFATYKKLMRQRDNEIRTNAEARAAEETRIELTLNAIQKSVERIEQNQTEMVRDIKEIQKANAQFGVQIEDLDRRITIVENRLNG